MEKRSKKFYLQYLMWYTLAFCIVSLSVCWLFIVKEKSFCWTTDAVSQYVPKAYYFMREFREVLSSIFSGEFAYQVYDFTQGLGDATALKLEPMYWLFALFQPENVEAAYCFVHFARFYVAGLSLSVFLFYFGNDMWETCIASMLYIYSGYGLFAGFRHSHFVVPLITLPLLLLSMEEIYRRKRWYLCTIFVAISFWCGYYFTYMNTIAMGVYFLIRFFTGEEKRSVKAFFHGVGTIIWTYTLGILIANITFFNSFADYLSSSRTVSEAEKEVISLTYREGWLEDCFLEFMNTASGPGNWMRFGFTALSYLAIIVLLIKRKRKSLKTALLVGFLGCCFPVVAYVFSGFSGIINRWCYIIAFLVAVITAFTLKDMISLKLWELFILGVGTLPFIYRGVWKEFRWGKSDDYLFFSGMLLIITYCCIALVSLFRKMPGKVKKSLVSVLTVVLLSGSGYMIFSEEYGGMIKEFAAQGNVLNAIKNTPLTVADEVKDDTFYRDSTDIYSRNSQNAAQVLDFYGVSNYSSTPFKGMVDLYRMMGLTTWNMGRLYGFDDRAYLDSLACVKYFYMEKGASYDLPFGYEKVSEMEENGKVYEVFENQYALPIGYTYDEIMSVEALEQYPVLNRQEVMMQSAVLDEAEGVEAESDIQITGVEIPIVKIYGEDVTVTENSLEAKKGGVLHIEYEGMDHAEIYLNLSGVKADSSGKYDLNFTSGDKKFSYILYCDKNAYSTGQEDYVFNLGYKEEKVNELTIVFDNKCKLTFDEITLFAQPLENLKNYTDDRKADVMENVEIKSNGVTGTISLEKDKLLVFSIPYQNGWTAYVDGEKTSLEKVNFAYMGLQLSAGKHIIELKYSMPGIKISLLLSAAGIAIFTTALVIRRKKRNAS